MKMGMISRRKTTGCRLECGGKRSATPLCDARPEPENCPRAPFPSPRKGRGSMMASKWMKRMLIGKSRGGQPLFPLPLEQGKGEENLGAGDLHYGGFAGVAHSESGVAAALCRRTP